MTQRPVFRQIAPPLDADDGDLAKLADQLGVPSLVKPNKPPAIAQEPRQDSPKLGSRPSPSPKPKNSQGAKKTPSASIQVRNALSKLTVELPGYIIDDVKRSAIERHTTARHVLLLALQAAGFKVDDADLVADGRRRKTVKS